MPELYVKMICALFPEDMPDSYALVKHLKLVFRLNDQEHTQLMEIARDTKVIINNNSRKKDIDTNNNPFLTLYF